MEGGERVEERQRTLRRYRAGGVMEVSYARDETLIGNRRGIKSLGVPERGEEGLPIR